MRRELVQRLERALPALQRDLVFNDIAGPLIELGVLMVQELNFIRADTNDSIQCATLVDVLAGKEDAAFEKLVNILKVDHFWLADELTATRSVADVVDSVPVTTVGKIEENRVAAKAVGKRPGNDCCRRVAKRPALTAEPTGTDNNENDENMTQGLTDEMLQLVRKNHRTSRDWTNLAHALGLTKLVNKIRVKVLVFGEDLDGCVVHLLQEWIGERPKDANLKNLVKALRGEGFNDVADELVEKFST